MRNAKRQEGIALIAVLGALTVMSLLVLSVTSAARTSMSASARHLARVQAQAALDSGIDLAIDQLANAMLAPPQVLSAPQELTVGSFKVVVSARPENAKVDLNFADVALLMGLFHAAGADDDQASALASAVLDWRDGDDLLHLNGAEEKEYTAAGLTYGPANKAFDSVEELRLVLGVTPALFECLRSDITVYTQQPAVNIDIASPLVRRAAGVSPDNPRPPASRYSVISGQSLGAGEVFEIVAKVEDARLGLRRSERAVVRVTGNRREPFWILALGAAPQGRCAADAESLPSSGASNQR